MGTAIILFLLFLLNLELIVYGLRQAKGQMNIIYNAVPIEEYLKREDITPAIRAKLLYLDTVRNYAMSVLGLNKSGSYQDIYDQHGDTLMWVVTGCLPYALEEKTWVFPFTGEVPYKGYFDKQLAIKELKRIEKEGYEGAIRYPGGWSTLGWFNDPILSKMLDDTKGGIADLIIHELVHATIFVKGEVEYNENLATFIGYEGTKKYLSDQYGMDSDTYKEYIAVERDYRLFSEHIIKGADYLKNLYGSFHHNIETGERERLKKQAMEMIVATLDTIDFYDRKYYHSIFEEKLPNNNLFMSFLRYRSGQKDFNETFMNDYNSDIVGYIEAMKKMYETK